MIDWHDVATRLAQLAGTTAPGRLLSLDLPLPHWPEIVIPDAGDWCSWQRPDRGLRLVGLGRACAVQSAGPGRFAALQATQCGLAAQAQSGTPLAFLGFAFAPQSDGPLPNASLWVPELLLRAVHDQVRLTLACPADQADHALARWQAGWRTLQPTPHSVARASTFTVLPNPLADAAFLARGRAALAAIARGTVDKLVLTRPLRLAADTPVDMTRLLATLAAQHSACATFGIGQGGQAFVGASPETLLAIQGNQVSVDALAGTAWQASALDLGADKNRREHDFVARAVAAALEELCSDIDVPAAPEVMQLNTLTHLRRRVTARRPNNVSALDLIARLHPTPAVGGTPVPAALDWLARHGDTRPAWYTGGFGWIDAAGQCDIAVALRCGLIADNTATLYAGAGFVAGSDPAEELAETEAKFAAMRAALAARPHDERCAA